MLNSFTGCGKWGWEGEEEVRNHFQFYAWVRRSTVLVPSLSDLSDNQPVSESVSQSESFIHSVSQSASRSQSVSQSVSQSERKAQAIKHFSIDHYGKQHYHNGKVRKMQLFSSIPLECPFTIMVQQHHRYI